MSKISQLIKIIPGYDPYQDAEDYTFFPKKADMAIDFFFDCLTHVKGEWAGQPIILENWQKAIVGNIFGWMDKDGYRRYREVLIYVPRKNAKTTLCAGIALLLFFCDNEMGGEIYTAAAERDQANILWTIARDMIKQDEVLSLNSQIFQRSIVNNSTNSTIKPISADAHTKHGYSSHGVFIDELHALKTADLVDVLETSTGSRRQPLQVLLTTADFDKPSICNEKHDYACKIRDRVIKDPQFLPVIYEALNDDDWKSEKVWKKTNPNFGISVKTDIFRRNFNKALTNTRYQNTFKRLHLNMKTDSEVIFISLDDWDECEKEINLENLIKEECWGGLDLSQTKDLTGFALFWPKSCVIFKWAWIPKEIAREKEEEDKVPYRAWHQEGYLNFTNGNVIDYKTIRNHVKKLWNKYNVQDIAYDTWGAEKLRQELMDEDGVKMVPFRQGWKSLSPPTKLLETLVLSGELKHPKDPVMRWCISNTVVVTDDAGNLKPTKKKNEQKIDPVVASIMAIGRASENELNKGSIYEENELKSI